MRCSTVRAVRAQVREKRRDKGRWVQVRRRERNGTGETADEGRCARVGAAGVGQRG